MVISVRAFFRWFLRFAILWISASVISNAYFIYEYGFPVKNAGEMKVICDLIISYLHWLAEAFLIISGIIVVYIAFMLDVTIVTEGKGNFHVFVGNESQNIEVTENCTRTKPEQQANDSH